MNLGIDSELKESALFTTSGWTDGTSLQWKLTLQQAPRLVLRNSVNSHVIHRCE